ncbi:M1 family metallopeptidase [Flavobacteriaceae bacterium]|nr:M1 family metallopeptidase [Flavobacteriaceae bacterium]MDC0117171.1 M1 family metallopeptidase [Flavobacteriaceae bacterium]
MKLLFYLFFSLPCVLLSQSNWQQNADYEMNVDIDVESYRFNGSQEILYTNNSPDTISKVYYHLYFNAFKPGSQMDVRSLNISDPDSRVKDRISKLEKNEEGDLSVFELKQDGKPVFFEQQETILLARLNKVLLPGKKTKLTLLFEGVVPKQIRRSGRNNKDGVALSMTQWYPKLAEYDFEGWHPNPYIAREFHGVWGDYSVKITIDKNYILGGTGYLQNSTEIGYGYHPKNKIIDHSEKEKLTWHFFAPSVHDFTWAADPDFVHDVVKGPNDVDLHFLYKTNQENWRKLQPHSVGLMKYFNENIGEYPWKQYSIIQGGDGGMEYAMSTLITGGEQYSRLLGTTSHEMAHAWFQHILANNEAKHPWMDEGFASYIDVLAENSVLGKTPKNPFKRSYDSYRRLANSGVEQPQTTHSDRYNYNFAYSVSAYSKGSVFLAQLGYIVGPKTLKKILKRYFNEFKFKHPSPNDFKRVAEKVSDLELEWYLNDWTRTAEKIDYAITYNEGIAVLERKGLIPMPIELVVTFKDETKKHYYIPTDLMRGVKKELSSSFEILPSWGWASPFYSFPLQKEVVKIEIDPSGLLADVDLKNNLYKL